VDQRQPVVCRFTRIADQWLDGVQLCDEIQAAPCPLGRIREDLGVEPFDGAEDEPLRPLRKEELKNSGKKV
jgi:hypothetical protein